MARSFLKLRDCLGKSTLPKRVRKAILREAEARMETVGGTEIEVAQAAVQKFHDIVDGDLKAASTALAPAQPVLSASTTVNPYRDAEGKLIVPKRASSTFDPALADFESEMKRLADRQEEADAVYNTLGDAAGGKVIGTDIARELLPAYAMGREGRIAFVHATGRVGAAYAKDRLWRELQKPGHGRIVLFTAGGVAAGKSTAVGQSQIDAADLIFDGTLRESDWAIESMEMALRHGWAVDVRYVQRPQNLVAEGAVGRAHRSGRWGPFDSLPATHLGAQQSAVTIAKHFEGNPRVNFVFFLNDGLSVDVPPTRLTLDQVDAGGRYSYILSEDERVSENRNRPEQGIRGGNAEVLGTAFPWRIAGYSPAEHVAIFKRAHDSGLYDPRVLRLLADGNGWLERVAGKVTPADKALPAEVPRLSASRVSDTGTLDLFAQPAIQKAASDYTRAFAKSNPTATRAEFKATAQKDGLGDVADDLFAFASANPSSKTTAFQKFKGGDRVTADEGTGEVVHVSTDGESLKIAFDTGGKLSRWILMSRVQTAPSENAPKSVTDAAPEPVTGTEAGPANSINERKATAADTMASLVASRLDQPGATPMTWEWLFSTYGDTLKGTQANGDFTPKDAYDALELGVNRWLLSHFNSPPIRMGGDAAAAKEMIGRIKRLQTLLPTQTKRTAETDEYQQFSTIPSLAYAANWVAAIGASDLMLEPSAGIGGLAVYAKLGLADVVMNELSERRAAILRKLGIGPVFAENAEQINNVLPAGIQPTVVVMNPPFSATAGRMMGARETANAVKHLESALARLPEGGRLVAIVGEGMAMDRPSFKAWWAKIGAKYSVRANVVVNGQEYAKYGTTFDNALVVIDKVPPTGEAPITGRVETVEDLVDLLEPVRYSRPEPQVTYDTNGRPQSSPRGTGGGTERITPENPVGPNPGGSDGNADGAGGGSSSTTQQPGASAPDQAGGPTAAGSGAAAGLDQRPGGSPAEAGDTGPAQRTGVESGFVPAGTLEGSENAIFDQYRPRVTFPGTTMPPVEVQESAAMAAIDPARPTYQPELGPEFYQPQNGAAEGRLSALAMEFITLAGNAHAAMVPAAFTENERNEWRKTYNGDEPPTEFRRAAFLGDGTGMGKGRQVSGVIVDNWLQGRTKVVWLSEKRGLVKDAKRDMADVHAPLESKIFEVGGYKAGEGITRSQGIAFMSYATLRSEEKVKDSTRAPQSRVDQLVNWLGKDFDGVIAFDEAHNMGNAIGMKKSRGVTKPSQQALAGLELQRRLPKARVIYVSATGATEVNNLSYAERLGLWGQGTPFANIRDFIGSVASRGTAAMELVAQNLKAMGLYVARSISWRGIQYRPLEHTLNADQRKIYDDLAQGWQLVLNRMDEALKVIGAVDEDPETGQDRTRNKDAKASARSKFWGAHQRFFNQIITSMKMPTVIEAMEREVAAGNAVVVQLVNTNEASQERAIAKRRADAAENEESVDLEDLDLTPRDQLLQMVQAAFPVFQQETATDQDGNEIVRTAKDSKGNPIINQEALAMREALLTELAGIRVPDGPLELMLNHFGPEAVAEVTGRGQRVVWGKDKQGVKTKVIEKRGKHANDRDMEDFAKDKKRILFFSNAGGTGRSYHADKRIVNKRKRVHILLQPGWRADQAIQGMGRTHRNNQEQPPEYILATTDVLGEKRFISSIARRLDQLGALTKGQRETASQGMFKASDNLESDEAKAALEQFYRDVLGGQVEGLGADVLEKEMGLKLRDKDGNPVENRPPITQFLNRLLSLTLETQAKVFTAFDERMQRIVEAARESGTLDQGVEVIRALAAKPLEDRVIHTHPATGATARYVKVELTQPTDLRDFPGFSWGYGYYLNNRSKRIYLVAYKDGNRTLEGGGVVKEARMVGVQGSRYEDVPNLDDETKWTKLGAGEAQKTWQTEHDAAPRTFKETQHFLAGTLLPVWDRFNREVHVSLKKVKMDDGRMLIGVPMMPSAVQTVLGNFGMATEQEKPTTADAAKAVRDGGMARLANGWRLKRARVSGESRVELIGPSTLNAAEMEQAGIFVERIQWTTRYFIPADNVQGVLDQLAKNGREVVELVHPKETLAASTTASVVDPAAVGTYLDYYGVEDQDSARAQLAPLLEPVREDAPSYAQLGLFDTGATSANSAPLPGSGGTAVAGGQGAGARESAEELIARKRRENAAIAEPTSGAALEALKDSGRISSLIPELITEIPKQWDVRGARIDTPEDAFKLLQAVRSPYVESLKVAVLDNRNQVVHSEIVTIGGVNESLAPPVSIFRTLSRISQSTSARRLLVAHNHPSGDPTPSNADQMITRRVEEIAQQLGFAITDHVITNGERYFSFREAGLISMPAATGRTLKAQEEPLQFREVRNQPAPRLSPWETAPRSALASLATADEVKAVVAGLRNADPDAGHVFYLNTKYRLVGIERVLDLAHKTPNELAQIVAHGTMREGAYGVIVHFPFDWNMVRAGKIPVGHERAVKEMTKLLMVRFLDAVYEGGSSGAPLFSSAEAGIMEESGELRTSTTITPEQDAAYMAAVNAGDTETAQRMVDAAAKKAMPDSAVHERPTAEEWDRTTEDQVKRLVAGKPLMKVWHVTKGDFNTFETNRQSFNSVFGLAIPVKRSGIFFAENAEVKDELLRRGLGDRVIAAFLNIKNPFLWASLEDIGDAQLVEIIKRQWNQWAAFDGTIGERFVKLLTDNGYDGAYINDDGMGMGEQPVWVAFNPSQIKSADPITRDASGRVIPLSERFNPESPSILFSSTTINDPRQQALDFTRAAAPEGDASKSAGELAKENVGLAISIANEYRNIPGAEIGDIASVAKIALMNAARMFDPTRGESFAGYAGQAIRNRLNTLFGREVRYARAVETTLDQPAPGEGNTEDVVDTISTNGAESVVNPVERGETSRLLTEAIDSLAERPRGMLRMRLEGRTLEEVGAAYDMSKQAAAKAVDVAMTRVRRILQDKGIRRVEDDGVLAASATADHQRQIDEEAARIANPTPAEAKENNVLWRDVYATHLQGRFEKLAHFAPGTETVVRDLERKQALVSAALREFNERIEADVKASFGNPGFWSKPAAKARLKAFMADLLPVAARLNPVAYDADGNFKFDFFWQRAGLLKLEDAQKRGVGKGDWIEGRHGEQLQVGKFLEELNGFQLERPITAKAQAEIFENFHRKFPEAAHWLDAFIAPGREASRVVDERGIRLPDFNRHSLADFYGEGPYGEIARVEGYTPDVARTRSIAGLVGSLLKLNWTSPARERKTGEARERQEIRNLFEGFSLRAAQAHEETIRRETAEKLIKTALKPVPASGVPDGWRKLDGSFFNPLVRAMRTAEVLEAQNLVELPENLSPEALALLDEARNRDGGEPTLADKVNVANVETLRRLVGDPSLFKPNQMVRREIFDELVRSFAQTRINNRGLALLNELVRRMTSGYLAHPFTWIQNAASNEIFKSMRATQRAVYGVLQLAAGDRREGRVALKEARNIVSGLLVDRFYNGAARARMEAIAPLELFERNSGVRAIIGDDMTKTPAELIKQANVPGAILKAVRYGDMDGRAKQQLATAAYRAHAEVALEDYEAKEGKLPDAAAREAWQREWIRNADPTLHRQVHASAVLYTMDYSNVPWWLDEGTRVEVKGVDVTPLANLARMLIIPFGKYPYNYARQIKRLGVDSVLDLTLRRKFKTKAERKNATANLAMMGMLMLAARLMLGGDDDDEVSKIGSAYDEEGERLEASFNTASRINVSKTVLGPVVRAAARMFGDPNSETDDYWLRIRTIPYANVALMLSAAETTARGMATGKNAQKEALGDNLASMVEDFVSTGMGLKLGLAAVGYRDKYNLATTTSTMMGDAAADLLTSGVLPSALRDSATRMTDPYARRLTPSKGLDYDPGVVAGFASNFPGLSRTLPAAGRVVANASPMSPKTLLAQSALDEKGLTRNYAPPTMDAKGRLRQAYTNPDTLKAQPGWREALRFAGVNVKAVPREGYRREIKGRRTAFDEFTVPK